MTTNADLRSLPCPACGSPVSLAGSDTHAICGYCGHRLWIEEKVQRARDDADSVAGLEKEAVAGLETAVLADARIRARTRALGVGAIVVGPAIVVAVVLTYFAEHLEPWLVLAGHAFIIVNTFFASVAAAIGWVALVRPPAIETAARARLAGILADREARRPEGKCPNCGAPVVAPGPVSSFECAHCRAPLVLAHGLLIRWVADARERANAWHWQAFHTRLEAELWPKSTWIVFTIALMMLSMSVYSCGELAIGLH